MDTPRILTVAIEVNVPGHIEAYKRIRSAP